MAEAQARRAAVSSSQYDLPQQPHESDSATAADIKSWVREILDWLVKLLPVIATILVAVLADQYKASMTASTLLSEREKADSQLRSEMFSKLVDPISGARSGSEVPIEREQLLAELLSLNFHEHIGLRPLLNHVDGRLARESLDPDKAERLTSARQSFRSVARSVISRQTAMLTRTNGDGTTADGARIQRLEIGAAIVGQQLPKGAKDDGVLFGVLDQPIEIMSPSGAHKLYLLLERPNWENETFHADVSIFAVRKDGASETELAHHEFELSWFDFPLTENTLLADGTRFAIVLDQVYDTTGRSDTPSDQLTIESVRRAKINVIWFPKDYIAARERPTNYREFRRSLGLDER